MKIATPKPCVVSPVVDPARCHPLFLLLDTTPEHDLPEKGSNGHSELHCPRYGKELPSSYRNNHRREEAMSFAELDQRRMITNPLVNRRRRVWPIKQGHINRRADLKRLHIRQIVELGVYGRSVAQPVAQHARDKRRKPRVIFGELV